MNWTGGAHQRTKYAKKGSIQKQKAHFAHARTQLQHSPGTPVAPFRPDFLQDSDTYEPSQHLPVFGTGSVRHTGRSARKRGAEIDQHSPMTRKAQDTFGRGDSQGRSSHFPRSMRDTHDDNERQKEIVRKDTDADSEMQLLEANKKRLLRQQDWVGVAPSRPVDMQFPSFKKKNQIGKRRKIDAMTAAFTRGRSPTTLLHPTGQGEYCGRDCTFMSGALPVLAAADNVQIRIGSAALTTAASTQPGYDARSQTNSDSMLFDEEGEDATQVLQSDAPRSPSFASHAHAADRSFDVSLPLKRDRSYSPEQDAYTHNHLTRCPDNRIAERSQHTTAVLSASDQSSHESEATSPSYRLTYLVGGVERPLGPVFDNVRSSMASHAASTTDGTGELQHVNADRTAEPTGHKSRAVGEPSQLSVRRQPNPSTIGDEEQWRPYLATGMSSSGHVRVDAGTGTSVPRPHVPALNTQADRTGWPQQTAKGNLTHVNLSKHFASLPAMHPRGGHVPDARRLPRPSVVKNINNDEALWQSFVLGSDPQSAIETIDACNETSEDSLSRATKGYASTKLPLSNAVTFVSSTPFPSTPFKWLLEQASCISDDARYAPGSGSRSITSMASYGTSRRVNSPSEEVVRDEDQGYETSAHSCFDDQTHASLQNHASHDSAMVGDTRTSRGESEQHGRAWDDVSKRAQASGSVVSQRGGGSSIWDVAESD